VSLLGLLGTLVSSFGDFLTSLSNPKQDSESANEPRDNSKNTGQSTQNIPSSVVVRVENLPPRNKKREAREVNQYRRDKKRFFWEKATFWAVAVYAAITLAIFCQSKRSADAAKEEADSMRKQLEAVLQLTGGQAEGAPSISITTSTGGEARFTFNNVGHVPAYDVHVKLRAGLYSTDTLSLQRELVSEEQPRQALTPYSPTTPNPDFVFPFRLSDTEKSDITKIYKSYVRVEGEFSYDSGFGKRVVEEFCRGYLWGPPPFFSAFPRCADIPDAAQRQREAREKQTAPHQ
jgi:hypothetical protein